MVMRRDSSVVERSALDRLDAGSSPALGAPQGSSVVERSALTRPDAGSSPAPGALLTAGAPPITSTARRPLPWSEGEDA
jgi:hypothetical protein